MLFLCWVTRSEISAFPLHHVSKAGICTRCVACNTSNAAREPRNTITSTTFGGKGLENQGARQKCFGRLGSHKPSESAAQFAR